MKSDFIKFIHLSHFPQNIQSIFLSGSNENYLEYCKERITKLYQEKNIPLSVEKCTSQVLLEQPEKAKSQRDLFAHYNHKLLIIDDPEDKLTPLLTDVLNNDTKDITFILSCAVTSKAKKLKAFHQTAPNSALVTCYLSTSQEKKDYLTNVLSNYNLQFDAEATTYAEHFLETNPEILAESCFKLSLYKTDKSPISLSDLLKCSTRPDEIQLEKLIAVIGNKSAKSTFEIYQQTQNAGLEDIYLLRTLSSHFMKLLELKSKITDGMSVHHALNTIHPPLFFKAHDMFKKHLQKWETGEIIKTLQLFKKAEFFLKTGQCSDFIRELVLASMDLRQN